MAWLPGPAAFPQSIAVSAATIGELQTGIEKARAHDPVKAGEIESWLERVLETTRVLPMDADCFLQWARLMRGRSIATAGDAMIAATALVHELTVATRNTKDFLDFGVPLLDPFAPP